MLIREHLKRSLGIGLAWGAGIAIFLFIIITATLWWETIFEGSSWNYEEDMELHCYKTLDRESCEKLFIN